MNTFEHLCQQRRSIRKYTSRPVEQEKLDYILRCALMSPSGKRVNPWEFYVVKAGTKNAEGEEIIRRFAGCRTFGSGMFDTAMAAIVVAVDAQLTDVWMCDGAIAAQNILLAASEQGLGACWCHIHEREEAEALIKQQTGIPNNLTVLCVISLGYKDEERKEYDLSKLKYEKIHVL